MYYPRVPSNLKNNVAKARCCRHSFPCKCLRDIDYSELGLLSIPIIFIQKQSTVRTNPNQRERGTLLYYEWNKDNGNIAGCHVREGQKREDFILYSLF